jgi:hypothetical protein
MPNGAVNPGITLEDDETSAAVKATASHRSTVHGY